MRIDTKLVYSLNDEESLIWFIIIRVTDANLDN